VFDAILSNFMLFEFHVFEVFEVFDAVFILRLRVS
jgi:hypothetical protein